MLAAAKLPVTAIYRRPLKLEIAPKSVLAIVNKEKRHQHQTIENRQHQYERNVIMARSCRAEGAGSMRGRSAAKGILLYTLALYALFLAPRARILMMTSS